METKFFKDDKTGDILVVTATKDNNVALNVMITLSGMNAEYDVVHPIEVVEDRYLPRVMHTSKADFSRYWPTIWASFDYYARCRKVVRNLRFKLSFYKRISDRLLGIFGDTWRKRRKLVCSLKED